MPCRTRPYGVSIEAGWKLNFSRGGRGPHRFSQPRERRHPRRALHQEPLGGCHEVCSDDDLMKLVAAGAGVAVVPRSLHASEGASTTIDGLDLRRTVYVFVIAGRPRTAAASTFINLLRAAGWAKADA